MHLLDFLWRHYVPEHDLMPGSVEQLDLSCRLFAEFNGDVDLDALSHELLNRWAAANPRAWAPSTMRRRLADLLAVWSYAYRIGVTDNAPDRQRLRSIRCPRRLPEAWSLSELRQIYDAAGQFVTYLPNGVQRCALLRAVLNVGYYSALRRGDLTVIKRAQLSANGQAIPQHKKRGSEVLVCVPQHVIDEIDASYPASVERVFAWPHRIEGFYSLWHKLIRAAGLTHGREHGLQKLRRTAVTHAEATREGWGAKLAGHEPGSVATWRSYIDPRHLRATVIRLPDISTEKKSEIRPV
jgi:integrase